MQMQYLRKNSLVSNNYKYSEENQSQFDTNSVTINYNVKLH